jgi:hypothetical protein
MTMPPYIKKEFTASSGRRARMKVFMKPTGAVADVTWLSTEHTVRDEEEAAQSVVLFIKESFPEVTEVAALNVNVQDEKERNDLLKTILEPGWRQR